MQKIPSKNISDEEEVTNSAIKEIANYYLSGKRLASGRRELGQQILLLVVSLSGASLYAMPAYQFAGKYGSSLAGETLLARQINYMISICVPASAVLYNATDIFFSVRRNEQIPKKLQDYLVQDKSKASRIAQDVSIVVGSAASAVPLMLVSLAYPLPIDSIALKIAQGIIIEVDNTILHFLPLKLAMQYPIYRFPVLPFEWAIKKYCMETKETPNNVDAEALRTRLITYVKHVQTRLLLDKSEWGFFIYHWTLSSPLKTQLQAPNPPDLLHMLVREFPMKFATPPTYAKVHDWLGSFSGVAGAALVVSSCAGYILSPINLMFSWTKNAALTALVTTPSLYFLTVLLAFFGYNAGKPFYDFLTRWGENEPKFPLEFKLYPKTFAVLMYLNVYMAFYCYGASEELVRDNFNEGVLGSMQPALIWLARTGLPFLCLSAMKDFYYTLLRKFAMHLGGEDSRIVARLMTSLEQLEQALHLIKPEVLAEENARNYVLALENNSADSLIGLINVEPTPNENTAMFKTDKNQGWGEWLSCCFWSKTPSIAIGVRDASQIYEMKK